MAVLAVTMSTRLRASNIYFLITSGRNLFEHIVVSD